MQIGGNQCDPPPHHHDEDRVNNRVAYFSSKMSSETHSSELFSECMRTFPNELPHWVEIPQPTACRWHSSRRVQLGNLVPCSQRGPGEVGHWLVWVHRGIFGRLTRTGYKNRLLEAKWEHMPAGKMFRKAPAEEWGLFQHNNIILVIFTVRIVRFTIFFLLPRWIPRSDTQSALPRR